jgi:hypothetical protein
MRPQDIKRQITRVLNEVGTAGLVKMIKDEMEKHYRDEPINRAVLGLAFPEHWADYHGNNDYVAEFDLREALCKEYAETHGLDRKDITNIEWPALESFLQKEEEERVQRIMNNRKHYAVI